MCCDCSETPRDARATFPSGLIQPEGSYRFGLEALLLAAFTAKTCRASRHFTACELGSGCGASLLAFALLRGNARCIGLEREPALLAAAVANAALLGLSERVSFAQADLAAPALPAALKHWQNGCSIVLANPPWRLPGAGRKSPSPLREGAMCSGPGLLESFCVHAAKLLGWHGFFCVVVPAALLPLLLDVLPPNLGLRKILPVASHVGKAPRRLLIALQKNASHDLELDFPLILHENENDRKNLWTKEAMAFCPWLGH